MNDTTSLRSIVSAYSGDTSCHMKDIIIKDTVSKGI